MLSIEDSVALSLCSFLLRRRAIDLLRHEAGPMAFDALLDAAWGGAGRRPSTPWLRRRAARALAAARDAGILVIPWGDPRYPPLLAAIPDPPPILWFQGSADTLPRPAVAIVGSRAATPYGTEVASRLASDLASTGAVVVSGLARGVDSAAHRGALGAGGLTVAVLGSAVDVVYPPEHASLASAIAGHGAVVSEWPPGSGPCGFHFPARNRIISGLSLAVIVVEAAERSGSLITAGCALEQGRQVMAVPGSILTGRHRGCHHLIRDGAAIVDSADDVMAELRGIGLRELSGPAGSVDASSGPILSRMAVGEAYDLDLLGRETGLAPAELLPCLLELELRGSIRRVDGGRFVRAGRTC